MLSVWLSIDECKDWSYDQLKDWTIEDVCHAYEGITFKEAEEAWGHIQLWLEDVDENDDDYYRAEMEKYLKDELTLGKELGSESK